MDARGRLARAPEPHLPVRRNEYMRAWLNCMAIYQQGARYRRWYRRLGRWILRRKPALEED